MNNKSKNQGFAKKIIAIPYLIMDIYVKSHKNTNNFQAMYSGAWFIAAMAMMVITAICFKVDFEVLYGIEYNTSLNESQSWWSAVKSALVIQFLILVCGGIALKTFIFGKYKDLNTPPKNWYFFSIPMLNWHHTLQMITFGALFVYGLSWTLDLSGKTYHAAKANAIGNKTALEQKHYSNQDKIATTRKDKASEIERVANADILAIKNSYKERLSNIENKYDAKRKNYKDKYRNKQVSKATLNAKIANYNLREANEKKPLLSSRAKKIEEKQNLLSTNLQSVNDYYLRLESKAGNEKATASAELTAQIEATAKETKGRNITYNIVNVILMIGLLFFTKGCIDDQPESQRYNTGSNGNTQYSDTEDTDDTKGSPRADTEEYEATDTEEDETVNTADHSTHNTESQKEDDTEYTEFEELETKAPKVEFFSQGGFDFKKTKGTVYIKHNSTYANLSKLNTWINTYETRANEYWIEGKKERAKKNSITANILIKKAAYLKKNFTNYGFKQTTSKNKQEGHLHNIFGAENQATA